MTPDARLARYPYVPRSDETGRGVTATVNRGRWLAKKGARRAFGTGHALLRPWRRRIENGAARVLTYHSFIDAPRAPFCVGASALEAQMRELADSGRAIGLNEFAQFLRGEAVGTPSPILVTVDDGLRSLLDTGLPIFREYAIPVVAFVTPALIGEARAEGWGDARARDPFLTWDEIQSLAADGVALGAHGHTHRSLAKLSRAEQREECASSMNRLRERIGAITTAFAYPYGTRADFDGETRETLRATGFQLVFTSQHGAAKPGTDPLEIPRIKVEGGDPLFLFRGLLDGAMDPWGLVDRSLWRVQANEG